MPTFDLFSTLQSCGNSLTSRLAEAKSKHKTPETPIYNGVETAINGLINDLKLSKDGEFTTEECFGKVAKKIEWTLGELMKYDAQNASRYEELATTLSTFVSTFSLNLPTSTSTHTNNTTTTKTNINTNTNTSSSNIVNTNNVPDTNIDVEKLYSSLNDSQNDTNPDD